MAQREKQQETWSQRFRVTYAELRNVTWPTQEEVINLTVVVFVVTVLVSLYLGVIDFTLSKGVAFILSLSE